MAEMETREAAGESFWTAGFGETVRTKVRHAVTDTMQSLESQVLLAATRVLLREYGLDQLPTGGSRDTQYAHFLNDCDDDQFPDGVEAVILGAGWLTSNGFPGLQRAVRAFMARTNAIFREHRVAWEVIEGQMVPMESQEMHAAVVLPALQLLSGRSGYGSIETAYQAALGELAMGDPSDAITDAGTVLQETLTALGYTGNALGPLIKDAKSKGLFNGYDEKLVKPVLDWVSADRSEKGDGHKGASGATAADAWLAVHVVGALVLRLLDPEVAR